MLTGLSTGTIHYFRVVASIGSGTSKGANLSFLLGAAPTEMTLTATSVGETGATLNGDVNPNGLATDAWFEWGTSPSLVTFCTSSAQALGAGTNPQSVTVIFNRDVEPATLVGAISVSSFIGNLPGVISYKSTTRTATFTPGTPFAPLTVYIVTVEAKVKSVDGVRLYAPYIFGFKTGSAF